MAKLLENTYRHVNIALVNEMAIFCRELGVDLWDAIRCAATKPFGFQPFYPGPGVGGHCIPIDPNYLSYKVRTLGYPFRFVELAQEINGRMPRYVTERAAELLNRHAKPLNGARVLLLGVTYKRDIADQRESPAGRSPATSPRAAPCSAITTPSWPNGRWTTSRSRARTTSTPRWPPPTWRSCCSRTQATTWPRSAGGRGCCSIPAGSPLSLSTSRPCEPGMRVMVCTIVHHAQDARIFYRQIRALLDAGHEVRYLAPVEPGSPLPAQPGDKLLVTPLPRAAGRRRLGALRAARREIARQRGDADLLLIHDPELLLALPWRNRPPTVWDVHEDTVAALTTKPWLPGPVRPIAAFGVRTAERLAERRVHLILAEHGYVGRFRRPHPVVPNAPYVPQATPPAGNDRRVVYVGHLSPDRGSEELVELARLLHPEGITVELIGPADARAQAQIEPARASGLLRWHGFVPNDKAMLMTRAPWQACRCCRTSRTSGTRCRPRWSSTWHAACRW